jgi:hypothetical protein
VGAPPGSGGVEVAERTGGVRGAVHPQHQRAARRRGRWRRGRCRRRPWRHRHRHGSRPGSPHLVGGVGDRRVQHRVALAACAASGTAAWWPTNSLVPTHAAICPSGTSTSNRRRSSPDRAAQRRAADARRVAALALLSPSASTTAGRRRVARRADRQVDDAALECRRQRGQAVELGRTGRAAARSRRIAHGRSWQLDHPARSTAVRPSARRTRRGGRRDASARRARTRTPSVSWNVDTTSPSRCTAASTSPRSYGMSSSTDRSDRTEAIAEHLRKSSMPSPSDRAHGDRALVAAGLLGDVGRDVGLVEHEQLGHRRASISASTSRTAAI